MPKILGRKPNFLFVASIVLLFSFIIWNYHSSWVVSQLTIETARQGLVTHEKVLKAVYANTEIVLTAPIEGKITLMENESKRFRKGETLLKIIPTGVNYTNTLKEELVTAPISGLFYSEVDGFEQITTPENLMNMDLSALLTQSATQKTPVLENEVRAKSSPVGKMVNNLYPSWMFVYLDDTDKMTKGDSVKFIIDNEEHPGIVMKVSNKPKGAVVRFNQYINGTTENRNRDIIWKHKAATKGLVIPVKSLCTFGEERGVYLADQGVINFKNVNVIDYNEKEACVVGIPEGAQVVTNPREGIEGLVVKKKT